MLSRVISSGYLGVESYRVDVEVDVSNGLPTFNIVGLADMAISESRERVRAALRNSNYNMNPKRIVVNLSPAGVRKEGPQFDLPIAIGIMKAMEYIVDNSRLLDYMYIGELSLSGEIKRTKGIINAVICARENNMKGIVVPRENYVEASIIDGIHVIPVETLKDVCDFIETGRVEEIIKDDEKEIVDYNLDFIDVKGQEKAKRALLISASGGHNLYMIGSPGAGKSMMSKRLPSIMPRMSQEEIVESTKIYSSAGMLSRNKPVIVERPFRSPHHSTSQVALVGGGRNPKAGEVSLAHNGVLFLDEATEFPRGVLEAMRQPIEDGKVAITRADYRVEYPSNFILILSCNPCPCGLLYESRCSCSQGQIDRYSKKISGPILDRMDLYVEIKRLTKEELNTYGAGENSLVLKRKVDRARKAQIERFKEYKVNSNMNQKDIKKYCKLGIDGKSIMNSAIDTLGLSARSYDKILKVARTIADIEGYENIEKVHLLEALTFRKR